MAQWCTIESDPGVFSELIEAFGVEGTEVEEIYSLDVELDGSRRQRKQFGLIFLFKYTEEGTKDSRPVMDAENVPGLFFARQIIADACATQALLSILMNASDLKIGGMLSSFKEFVQEFDPETKGLAIGDSDPIRAAHNSFARPEPFVHDGESKSKKGAKEDAYHFIAYLPYNGGLYEIDGLRRGPIFLGEYSPGTDWLAVAKPAVEERISRYSSSETHFALMTVCEKKSCILAQEMEEIDSNLMVASGEEERERLLKEREMLREEISDAEAKKRSQVKENVRRRHNYLPMVVTLLKALARKNKLGEIRTAAEQRRAQQANQSAH